MNRRKLFVAVMTLVTITFALAACGGGQPDVISLGVITVTSGGAAFIGQEQLDFVNAYVDVYNEEMGTEIVVTDCDTEINPDVGIVCAEQMVADDSVLAVIGPAGSQVCEATQPTFAEGGLAHITPSCTAIPLTDPGTDTFFRPIPHDGLQGPTDANYIMTELGASSVWLIDDQSSYATGLTDVVADALDQGGVAVERASVNADDTDMSPVATTIMADPPDVVFFASQQPPQIGQLAVQLREQGWEGTYVLPDGGFSPEVVETGQDAVEGALVSFFAPDAHFVPQADAVTARYMDAYGDAYGGFGSAAMLTAQIAVDAISRCVEANDVNRECVLNEIGATDLSAADSVLGVPVRFGSGNQNEVGVFSIFQVEGGEFVLIQ